MTSGANVRVDEISIMGYPPPDTKFKVTRPGIAYTKFTAERVAGDLFNRWRARLLEGRSKTTEHKDRFVVTFSSQDGADLFSVTVDKDRGKVEAKPLGKWVPTD